MVNRTNVTKQTSNFTKYYKHPDPIWIRKHQKSFMEEEESNFSLNRRTQPLSQMGYNIGDFLLKLNVKYLMKNDHSHIYDSYDSFSQPRSRKWHRCKCEVLEWPLRKSVGASGALTFFNRIVCSKTLATATAKSNICPGLRAYSIIPLILWRPKTLHYYILRTIHFK